jgi:hypothetical protein
MPRNPSGALSLMQPQAFYRAVADDFSAVDGIIKKQLTSRVPLVSKIGDYITSAGGKRLRPLLVLLCGKALGREGDDLRLLAATIEFLHTATLLHDDVVDMSGMRRGRSTANAMWGNAPSVLVGDFLYSRSFEMMVELGSMPVMKILSRPRASSPKAKCCSCRRSATPAPPKKPTWKSSAARPRCSSKPRPTAPPPWRSHRRSRRSPAHLRRPPGRGLPTGRRPAGLQGRRRNPGQERR